MEAAVAIARMVALCLAVVAMGGAAARVASRLTADLALRLLTAGVLGCAAVIVHTLLLGFVALGTNGLALLLAAGTTWATVAARVPPATGPRIREQLRGWGRSLGTLDRALLGGAHGAAGAALGYLVWQPFMPYDALMYHLAEPVVWLHTGRPGGLHVLNQDIPVEAYPKHVEVLVAWLLGLSHSAVVGTLAMFGFLALAVTASVSALTRLRVGARVAGIAAGAMLLLPVGVQQLSGVSTDLPALAWIATVGALCLGAVREPRLAPVVLVAAGLALGTKATTGPPIAAALVVTAVVMARSSIGPRRGLVAGGVAGAFLGGLWYVQTWVAFGAPLHPFYRFPSGPPTPPLISIYGASFRDDPAGAVRAATLGGYFDWVGGGLVLLAGLALAAAVALVARGRSGRWLRLAVAAAVIELLLWASGPFTGFPGFPGTEWFPAQGVRYLYPGLPLIVLPIALLTTAPRVVVRDVAEAVLLFALVANGIAYTQWGPPYGPPLPTIAIGAAAGGATAVVVGRRLGATARAPAAWRSVVGVGTTAALLAAVSAGHWSRSVSVEQPMETAQFAIPEVVSWLGDQPAWRDGDDPVAVGPFANALLAGPRFEHALEVVTQSTTCDELRLLRGTHWVVLSDAQFATGVSIPGLRFDRAGCLRDIPPDFAAAGYVVYRPALSASGA